MVLEDKSYWYIRTNKIQYTFWPIINTLDFNINKEHHFNSSIVRKIENVLNAYNLKFLVAFIWHFPFLCWQTDVLLAVIEKIII